MEDHFLEVSGYDSEGNIIKCDKCEKKAGYHEIGIDNSINLCSDHSPYANATEAQFIYRPPSESLQHLSKIPRILENTWVITKDFFEKHKDDKEEIIEKIIPLIIPIEFQELLTYPRPRIDDETGEIVTDENGKVIMDKGFHNEMEKMLGINEDLMGNNNNDKE